MCVCMLILNMEVIVVAVSVVESASLHCAPNCLESFAFIGILWNLLPTLFSLAQSQWVTLRLFFCKIIWREVGAIQAPRSEAINWSQSADT